MRAFRRISVFAAHVRALSVLGVVLGVGATTFVGAAPAGAAEAPIAAGPRSLAVAVPPEAVVFRPGHATSVDVRVSNPGNADLIVSFQQRELELGDNGRVNVLNNPDPKWGSQVILPEGEITIPGQGHTTKKVSVEVPEGIQPDIYLIGFVVTPKPAPQGSVQVINEIGSYFKLDIPGKRDWKLDATFDLPRVVIAGSVTRDVEIHNGGRSSIEFWGDITSKSKPFSRIAQQRIERKFLPSGKRRSVEVTAKPKWGIGLVEVPVRIGYPANGGGTQDLLLSQRVLIIHPAWIVVAGVIALVVLGYVVRRVLRKRARIRAARELTHGKLESKAKRREKQRLDKLVAKQSRESELTVASPVEAPAEVPKTDYEPPVLVSDAPIERTVVLVRADDAAPPQTTPDPEDAAEANPVLLTLPPSVPSAGPPESGGPPASATDSDAAQIERIPTAAEPAGADASKPETEPAPETKQ